MVQYFGQIRMPLAKQPKGTRKKRRKAIEIPPAQCIGPICDMHRQQLQQFAQQCLADSACRAAVTQEGK